MAWFFNHLFALTHPTALDRVAAYAAWPPGLARGAVAHAARASFVSYKVRLPRRRSPASYSRQFAVQCRSFGMWCRPLAFFFEGIGDCALRWAASMQQRPIDFVFLPDGEDPVRSFECMASKASRLPRKALCRFKTS